MITIAVHAAVLALPLRPAPQHGEGMRTALEVRMLPPADPIHDRGMTIEAQPTPRPSPRVAEYRAERAQARPQPPSQQATSEQAAAQRPNAQPQPTQPTSDVASPHDGAHAVAPRAPIAIAARGWGLRGIASEDDAFLPRVLLTVPPQALEPVIVPAPDFVRAGEHYRGELTLFIDESGAVVRVKADDDSLPHGLAEVARRAFMAARFAPGELEDLGAVKSRIRIEIVFDGGSAPAATVAAAPAG